MICEKVFHDRNFTPRLGQGDLPDLTDYAVLTAKKFRDAISLWQETMSDYQDLLYATVIGDTMDTPLFTPIEQGDWRMLMRSHRYRNRSTGEVIYNKKYLELRDTFTDRMHPRIENLSEQLIEREVNLHQWVRQMAHLGQQAHLVGYMFGAGGYNAITQTLLLDAEAHLRRDFSFLSQLASDVLAGNRGERQDPTVDPTVKVVTGRGLRNRAVMWIESITRSFERARTTVYQFHPDRLPNYPADGSMECLVRCRCHWRFRYLKDESYYHAFWIARNDARTCMTCRRYSQIYNPYTVVRF